MVDFVLELIGHLPRRLQQAIGLLIAAALFMFLVFLGYLYFTGNLW